MDHKQFYSLYTQYKQRFTLIALSYVHDSDVAEDVVSESFTHFLEKGDTLQIEGPPQAYLLGIVKNKCLEHLRRCRIRRTGYRFRPWELDRDIAILTDPDFNARLFASELEGLFREGVASLPEITRKVFLASREEGLNHAEIAARYGLTGRQVKREMHKALSTLRLALRDYLPLALLFFCSR